MWTCRRLPSVTPYWPPVARCGRGTIAPIRERSLCRTAMNTTWSALILDDDPGLRQSVRLCLEADNVRVLGVGTAAGALEALERSRFDVVFLDLWLKEGSGLEVLPEILRRHPGIAV